MNDGDPRIIIVGTGFGGIAAAIELQAHGFGDLTLLDRAPGLGGTWRHNTYPGAACDVPSHLYSFSFAQRRDWTRLCSPQSEILAYLEGIAREYAIDRRMEFGVEVESCAWDDAARTWTVTAQDGRSWEGDAVIVATGQLHRTAHPRIPGLGDFAGHAFHSAQWDHELRPARQARRRDRHGCQRGPVRPRGREGGCAAHRVPALGQLVHAAAQPLLPRPDPLGDPPCARGPGVPAALHVPVRRVADAHDPPPADRSACSAGCARRCSCAGRSPTASCAGGSGRTTPSAASGCCSARRSCRRSGGRTSSSSPSRSRG